MAVTDAPADAPPLDGDATPTGRRSGLTAERVITVCVLVAAVAFTLWRLHPRLLLTDTTPAGGDMGAHVWAPAFLRDHLLPSLRLTGWTQDWYAASPPSTSTWCCRAWRSWSSTSCSRMASPSSW